MFPDLIILAQTVRLWYLLPLVISFSLVYGATRHERMFPIIEHAVRFSIWILSFLGILYALLWFIS